MPNNITSNIKLYADDALLYRTIHSVTDTYILQHDLDIYAASVGLNLANDF